MTTHKPYHHGDLRNKLIETGIMLVSEEGMNNFSLRKVAARCGVSHGAPYAHFENMEALQKAMGEHVTERFLDKLHRAVQTETSSRTAITALGVAYINFFSDNPHYFNFLFYYSGISIDLDHETCESYPPFAYFREISFAMLNEMGVPEEQRTANMLALWSMVHGMASLLTNQAVHYSGNWAEVLTKNLFTGGQ